MLSINENGRGKKVDIRALNEWECKVNECIEKRIRSLKSRHINRRKKHILKSEKHLRSLQELHSMYVLVPADKASSNIIVVCKKYYLEVVLGEVNDSTTYEHVTEDYCNLVSGHLKFMAAVASCGVDRVDLTKVILWITGTYIYTSRVTTI